MSSLRNSESIGKFKQKRGGGRSFSKDMGFDKASTVADKSIANRRKKEGAEDDDDDDDSSEDEDAIEEEEEEESEDEEEEGAAGGSSAQPELSRAERKQLKKDQAAQKIKKKQGDDEEEDPDFINPNHIKNKLNIADIDAPRELTRRERSQKEKQEAKERYWKLHLEGKTDEAKSDLARLAKIRADREAAQAKRKAETEAKAKEVEAKKQQQRTGKRA
ncbi:hypothetical protein BDN72DRAFT_763420 [Pluteus cervinus]|uniref:Uncharacterized protein n=1 Tax=Pluteus cervinus TaxID=181527 RepID=A0ACD3B2Y8_9AGAR|nr:hypothetical protein BDN72DRAFT_763420 [Pluteus cervinus]